MTYQRHWLLSWGGTLAGEKDIWANNIRLMNREAMSPDGLDDGTMEDMLDDFVKDIRAFHSNAATKIARAAVVKWVKFNEIGPDGRYKDQTQTHARYLVNTAGPLFQVQGGVVASVPAYQSVCVTLTTDAQRGPGSKGRLFLPQCAPQLQENGELVSTDALGIANQTATFLTALGNEAGLDLNAIAPAVVSNVGEPGPMRRITGVKVGSVPDVISRRKNAILETYVSATVSTG